MLRLGRRSSNGRRISRVTYNVEIRQVQQQRETFYPQVTDNVEIRQVQQQRETFYPRVTCNVEIGQAE